MDTPWPFAARAAELAQITAVAADPDAPGLLVAGADGSGRSRLLDQALGSVSRQVVAARAGQAPTVRFGAVAHLFLSQRIAEDPEEAAAQILPPAGRILLVADDAHLLDASSSLLLRALAGSGRVTLLATLSDAPVVPDPLAGLPVLRLDPPTREDVAEILSAALGGAVDERTVRGLHRMAGGDLRLLRELVRVGIAGGTLIPQAEDSTAPGWHWRGDLTTDGLWQEYEHFRQAQNSNTPGPSRGMAGPESGAPGSVAAGGVGSQDVAPGSVAAGGAGPAGGMPDSISAGAAGPVAGLPVEGAIAVAAVLAGTARAAQAEAVLAGIPAPADDALRAVYSIGRAANLAWWLGRTEEADRLLATSLEQISDAEGSARVRCQVAAADLHRARSREALDGAEEAAELVDDGGPAVRAEIASVQALAAALTGQTRPAASIAERALAQAGGWVQAVPECGPYLSYALTSAQAVAGELAGPTPSADPVEGAAAWAQVHRLRGQIHEALSCGWDGARRLRNTASIFAGPCLGEVVQAAAVTGKLEAARAALTEADRRAVPALRTMWFPVALARPWLLAAEGMMGAAVHDLLGAAAAAETLELRRYELFALHDVVRLGAAGVVADRLAGLADDVDGELAALAARHAEAAASRDAAGLAEVSAEFERLGMIIYAAEAAAQAAAVHWDREVATELGTRAWVMLQRCRGVRTPALRTVVPGLTMLQQQTAELAAAGRTDAEIAAVLDISPKAVAEHLTAAGERLGVSGRDKLADLLRM